MRNKLQQTLIEKFGVTQEDLNEATVLAEEQGTKAAEVFIRKGLVTEEQILEAVGELYSLPLYKEQPLDRISTFFTRDISIQFLKKNYMVPVALEEDDETLPDDTVFLVVNDPAFVHQTDDLAKALDIKDYEVVLGTRDTITTIINMAYNKSRDSAEQLVQNMEESSRTIISEIEETADLLDDTSDSQIIKLVNHIISQSIKARASDIHIEPYQDSFKVRYRVDGILLDLLTPPKWIQASLISRIKIMAKLDIAEKRLPQDGRIDVRIGENDIDIRVSTVPTIFGERVVLRLLSKSGALLTLSEFGLGDEKLATIDTLIRDPNGIILVTGPTGSGKTTTLYAILSAINSPEVNIITVEDPIEYQLNGVGQIQVNSKIGLSFAKGLRSIVRQDPDVILVGEIRDSETADIAVQSALTGHLVFSTLHTNDSASAVTRLVDIGLEPFLLSSALNAIVAQRLVRRLCEDCKEEYQPDKNLLLLAGLTEEQIDTTVFYKAHGCDNCINTGYRGRMAIMEIMVLDENIKSLVLQTSDSNVIKAEAVKRGMKTLRRDGISRILEGITTVEEVLRVTNV